MHVHARTLTVKVSCILMLETEITTDISWDNEASGALAYEYSVAVLCMQKQYDWEHGPIKFQMRPCCCVVEPVSCPQTSRFSRHPPCW